MPKYHVAMVAALGLHGGRLRKLLLLGVGGGALAMFLQNTYGPDVALTCVEPSYTAIELGRKYFGLESRCLRLIVGSAESFLKATAATETFDAILVDTTEPTPGRHGLVAPHGALCRRRALRAREQPS